MAVSRSPVRAGNGRFGIQSEAPPVIQADDVGVTQPRRKMRMTPARKLESYKQHMAARGIGEWNAFPPLWRILWQFGVAIPPPPFLGFLGLFALAGGFFGPVFALAVWLFESGRQDGLSVEGALWLSLIAGTAFGLAMAAYYRHMGRKLGLGSWSAFPASGPRS
jgi:hypothetical protein